MFVKTRTIALAIVLMTCSIIANATQIEVASEGQKFTIEQLDTDHISFVETDVKLDGDDFIVYGEIKRKSVNGSHKGHVDVAVKSSDGNLILAGSTNFSPPFGKLRRNLESNFSARFDTVPPEGSVISIKYHEHNYRYAAKGDCAYNDADKGKD